MSSRIVALIVTRNRLAKLRHTLVCTLAESFDAVVVADNASDDGTNAFLTSMTDARLDAFNTGGNLGGAGGFACAMARALQKHNPDWLVLFDDDAWPEAGCIKKFRALLPTLAPKMGVVAASVFHPDGRVCDMNRPVRNPFRNGGTLLHFVLGLRPAAVKDSELAEESTRFEVDLTSFVGFFVSTCAAQKAGLPRAEIFIYGDDYLYSDAVSRAGFSLVQEPQLRFLHDNAVTSGARRLHLPEWKMYFNARNSIEVWRQTCGIFFRPIAWIRARQWRIEAVHHPDPAKYRMYLEAGLRDGWMGDFSLGFEVVAGMGSNGVAGIHRQARQ